MCEKKFEGKVLSPPPSDDINDEIIINDDIKDENIKPRKRSKKKIKICDTCNQDILANEMRNIYMFKDTYHQLKAKEYCEEHEAAYNNHKCKPSWCGDCGYLINYEITIDFDKK
tara:strand:+ start:332 stop:673 length:342 start_codon:yes stop_codon:yes gene_type:complete